MILANYFMDKIVCGIVGIFIFKRCLSFFMRTEFSIAYIDFLRDHLYRLSASRISLMDLSNLRTFAYS